MERDNIHPRGMRVMIVGATSAIAEGVAREYAAKGASLYLAARNVERLEMLVADLGIRGASAVYPAEFSAMDGASFAPLVDDAVGRLGGLDLALVAHGVLPDQSGCEEDLEAELRALEVNGVSTVALLHLLARCFEGQGHGTIAVIGSVAGDRGRQSNYVYGASKALVAVYMQGLRNRLHQRGVRVLTIKPGFVDTPMTADFDRGGILWSDAKVVARAIVRAVDRGRDVVYVPWFWYFIMLVVRSIPEVVFKRLRL